jgi:copper chaperone CopZ
MKKLFVILFLLLSLRSNAQIRSAELVATGLTCSLCSKAIYNALVKLPFIKNVIPNVQQSSFDILFKEGSNVSLDLVKKAVNDAGFSVGSLKPVITFHNETVADDSHVIVGETIYHFVHVTRQTLNGDKTVTVIDKNFISAREHKKYSKYTKMKCFETGTKAACCPKGKISSDRVYNVTL